MSQPVPEESNEAIDLTEPPADEHDSHLPARADTPSGRPGEPADPQVQAQEENARSSLNQPSDGSGGG